MYSPGTIITPTELQSAIVRDPLVVGPDMTVMAAIAQMSSVRTLCPTEKPTDTALDQVHLEARSSCVLVAEAGQLLGIFTERDVVRLSAQPRSPSHPNRPALQHLRLRDAMTSPVMTLCESDFTDLFSVVNLLQQHRIRHLPIVGPDNHLLGLITHESLRQLARPVDLLRLRRVSEVMTAQVVCAEPTASMQAIAGLMADQRVGSVLVTQSRLDAAGQAWQLPLGITTERDIVQFQSLGMDLDLVQVQRVMSTPVFSVHPDESLMVVQQIMARRAIQRLVVTGTQGELLGIVTQSSLLQAINPLELYMLAKILEQRVSQLETEKINLLEQYATELEHQVEQRTLELKAKAEREQFIAAIAADVRASLQVSDILASMVRGLQSLLGCDRIVIWQLQPDGSYLGVAESPMASPPSFVGRRADDPDAQLSADPQIRAQLIVPLGNGDQPWGLLSALAIDRPWHWSAADVGLLEQMSTHLAIALQQATAYQKLQAELAERQRAEAEREQAVTALIASEERFRAFMEHNPAAAWITDAAGRMAYANPTYQRLFLIAPDFLGQSVYDLYPADIAQIYVDNIQKVARTGQVLETIEPGMRPDGSLGEFLVLKFPLPQPAGPPAVGGVAIDITDRQQAAAERLQSAQVRKSLSLLENILDIILAGYWDWDLQSHEEYLSPGFKRMFGYADHELPNTPASWQRLIFPEDLPGVWANFDRHVQSHGVIPFYNEVRYRHRDGSTVWVICSGQVIEWDASGQPRRMIGCHVNVTQRKQAEEKLQKSDIHLKAAQRIGKLGSWEFAIQTGQLTWSDEVFRIYGLDPALGPPTYAQLQHYIHPEDWPQFDQTVQAAIASRQSYELEHRLFRPDGTLVYVFARGEMIDDATGQLTHIIGTALDITDRKVVEAKLLQTSAQLAASNRELEAFAYSVSHDLRAPLRAIDGFSLALMENYGEHFDEEKKDYCDRIRRNVQRMGRLIDDLLRLSRVSLMEMTYDRIDLSALVQEQITELQCLEPARQVNGIVAPGAIVWADVTLMRVVISNLVQNAWKFTSHHATARIEFGVIAPAGESVYFIRDDGAGFNMAYADMLFGVFQRLHNTQEFPGTGIGLATVQRAIHRHGGRVWAEGIVEQGTTIYFTVSSPPTRTRD